MIAAYAGFPRALAAAREYQRQLAPRPEPVTETR
jgi:hypothetical protein